MEATRQQLANITGLLIRRKKRNHNCLRVDIDKPLNSQAKSAALN
jgi:hypothetical protein